MEVDVERHVPAALPSEKRPDTHCVGGCWGAEGRCDLGVRKIKSLPPELESRTFWPLASRFVTCKSYLRICTVDSLTCVYIYIYVRAHSRVSFCDG